MRFEYDKGTKDQEAVDPDRCELAPTPLVLAEKLKRKKAYEFLSNAWAPIASVSGISKEDLMDQARRGALPAGVLVAKGAVSAVEKFLEKGHLSTADLSKRDAMGCSCLHRAARTGVPEAVCTIVKLGHFEEEDFVAVDTDGWSVLHHAASAGSGPCVEVLLQLCHLPQEALALPDSWGRSPAHIAAEADAIEVIQVLAKHQAPAGVARWHHHLGATAGDVWHDHGKVQRQRLGLLPLAHRRSHDAREELGGLLAGRG